MKEKEELVILKQLFSNLSEEQKRSFLDSIKTKNKAFKPRSSDSESVQAFLTEKRFKSSKPTVCPFCGGTHIIKNGLKDGRQRYLCKGCKKTFGNTHNTILKSSKKDLSVWKKYIHCMIEKYPLRKCAKECGISLSNAFIWRHKILDALQNMMDEVTLDGVVEADETFTNVSYKGHHKSFKLPRPAFKHGGKAAKRGLSKEKVCIPCGINLNGLSIARISNLGKPKWTDIEKVLGGRVEHDSVFVTDSFRGYQRLSYEMSLNHIRIPRNKHRNGVFNIQLLNNYHAQLKGLINIHFKGVATKYLNNYLVYHNLVNFSHGSEEYKEVVMRDFVLTTECVTKSHNVSKRQAIPI